MYAFRVYSILKAELNLVRPAEVERWTSDVEQHRTC